jgi:hypothetical protein
MVLNVSHLNTYREILNASAFTISTLQVIGFIIWTQVIDVDKQGIIFLSDFLIL